MGKVFWLEPFDFNVFCGFFSKCLEIISADAQIGAVTTMFVWQVVIRFQTSCSYLYESIKGHVMRNKLTAKQQINISFYHIQLIEQESSGRGSKGDKRTRKCTESRKCVRDIWTRGRSWAEAVRRCDGDPEDVAQANLNTSCLHLAPGTAAESPW